MFFAVAMTAYGTLELVGKPHETAKEVEDNFAGAWALFNGASAYGASGPKQYGIAQIVQGIELVEPPKFRAVPFVAALPPPAPATVEPPKFRAVPFVAALPPPAPATDEEPF